MGMKGVNKAIILGRVGQEPEVRYSQSGMCFCTVSVATSEEWRDKQTGEQKQKTEWHRAVIQGRLAEIAGQYIRKGSQVYLEGKLQTRKWQDQSGADKYTTEIVVDGFTGVMQLIGARPQDHSQSESHGGLQQARGEPQQNNNSPAHYNEPGLVFDDDIPF